MRKDTKGQLKHNLWFLMHNLFIWNPISIFYYKDPAGIVKGRMTYRWKRKSNSLWGCVKNYLWNKKVNIKHSIWMLTK